MNHEEKLYLDELFEKRGLLQIHGFVGRVAEMLDVSRASVYDYRANRKKQD